MSNNCIETGGIHQKGLRTVLFRSSYMRHINLPLVAWSIFTIFYWIAAVNKPFHVDEYFSWVYSERCSLTEIIELKETGIGHPPLYHLAQKLIQTISPVKNNISVRLFNYLIGVIFVIVLTKYLSKKYIHNLFLISLSMSGAILGIFVFSRMWGLITLFSLIVVIYGERFIKSKKPRDLTLLFLYMFAGFVADYGFILVMPYILMVLLYPIKRKSMFMIVILISLIMIFGVFTSIKKYNYDIETVVYISGMNIFKICSEFIILIFNPLFIEMLIAASIVLICLSIYNTTKNNASTIDRLVNLALLIVPVMGLLYLISINNIIRYRGIILLLLLLLLFVGYYIYRRRNDICIDNNRLLFGIIGGSIIVLVISPIFWRELVYARYINVLLPFVVVLLYEKLPKKQLSVLAVLLMASGLMYVNSAMVDKGYPAKSIQTDEAVVFQDVLAYSSQYFVVDQKSGNTPYLMSFSHYERSCKLCTMGTTDIPFHELDSFIYLGSDPVPREILDKGYIIQSSENWSLTPLDKMIFKYAHPLRTRYHKKYFLERT